MGGVWLRDGCGYTNEIPEGVPITLTLPMLAPVWTPYSGKSGLLISAGLFCTDCFLPLGSVTNSEEHKAAVTSGLSAIKT